MRPSSARSAPWVDLAGIAGPLLGGVLLNAKLFGWGWRNISLIDLSVGVVALALAPALLTESRTRRLRPWSWSILAQPPE